MATASGGEPPFSLPVDEFCKVAVYNENPENTNANVILECFNTVKPYKVVLTSQRLSGKVYVQFPVRMDTQTQSTEILKEDFLKLLEDYVTEENSFITIPIDDIKTWTKSKFCEKVLEEFLQWKRKRRHSFHVKLSFCTLERHNFDEAVKGCKKVIGGARSKSVDSSVRGTQGPSIHIVEGSLDREKADALACTVSSSLDLRLGAVSDALLQRGGYKLQSDLKFKCPNYLPFGEIVTVSGHRLDCQVVLFGVMLAYDKKFAKGYKTTEEYYRSSVHEFVQRCLNKAEKDKFRSIAFPAIGAGVLGYPVETVADQMFETVSDWRGEYVKEVRFVIYPSDTKVLKAFKSAEKRRGKNRESASGFNSVSVGGIVGRSGQIPVKTSEFHLKNPHANSALSKVECKFPIPKGYTEEIIQICCKETIDKLKKSECDVSFIKDEIIVKCPPEVVDIATTKMVDALCKMKKEYPSRETLDLTQSNFNYSDVMKKLEEVKQRLNVNYFINSMKTKVEFFGKKMQDVKAAKDRVVSSLLPPRGKADPDSSKDMEDTGGARSRIKPTAISTQFSWSTRTKALNVFETKEKIIVKVYSADILTAPVDCIVNAANVDLNHGGGIARAIEKAAGKDLTKEGCDYLKKHGKLQVGEACSTGAGKMQYRCVIHAVGPCWSYYKPYSLRDVEKCEHDLYNAVINSLGEAEKMKMETIAVSSISSGIYGCPLDLCSVQYARAVVDYSRCAKSPLKEIHFVDTNMEMVQIIQNTFRCMIPDEKVPRSYDKLKYVKPKNTANRKGKDGNNAMCTKEDVQTTSKSGEKRNVQKPYQRNAKDAGLVVYPYCHSDYPPGQINKEFACCFGPGQNLYIYSGDILSLTGIDIIACGNLKNGKTKGYLANAILEKFGNAYKTEVKKQFKTNAASGSVVVCASGDIKSYKWVAHAILFDKKQCKDEEDRENKVTQSFHSIFRTLKEKQCHSIALPLVGTGKGNADPVYYAQRFVDGLHEFCSFNQTYHFQVHLVHKKRQSTGKAIETINKAIRDARPLSVCTKHPKPQKFSSSKDVAARPKSAAKPQSHDKHDPIYNRHRQNNHGVRMNESRQNHKENCQQEGNFKNRNYGGKNSLHQQNVKAVDRKVKVERVNGKSSYDLENDHLEEQAMVSDAGTTSSEDEQDTKTPSQIKAKSGNLQIFEDPTPVKRGSPSDVDESEEDEEEDEDVEEEDEYSQEDLVEESEKSDDNVEDEVETCVICMDDITDPQKLPCGHVFCTDCIQAQFTYKEACPTCGKVCGTITGDQPYGKMDVNTNERASCVGFEGCGRIEISYRFPDGTQGSNHPVPGARFKGITRTAYLPDNKKGREICEMLKVAFERKLVFTIGRSRTTGADGVITWNDIHHKTDPKPNTQFGYPDPTYLDRVTEELEVKGVTVNDIPTRSVPTNRRR